ncbi:MAG TPA: biosynthetic arginine decarboxylase [Acidobacteriota bacterium]|jgi:arginine decarboxylase|nr:biosynthetic arginine decarboxylase [Acidobacteriota bacterium]HNR37914.1 biosynthetic arginine decarboxylase [Acidobacteriota bacterium]HNT99519.1 biosynthetic arginine decarboxylase [Acidobacteriota bacterium]HQO24355.1 biosynthetic arginine decarboxylase [Acidobacteriota bacterium]HQP74194.1 biosynthetic arginine decarboxylase [Acidobacteriota bacterium]
MRQKIKLKEQTALKQWSIDEARELYNILNWGKGFFDINTRGDVVVRPEKTSDKFLDIKELVDELRLREISPPVLIRFTDILKKRIEEIQKSFQAAIKEYGYQGEYIGVYPIKVNQSKQVVEDIIEFGRPYRFGLEAGSKPELLIVVASLDTKGAPIICNGYKDTEFIEIALWALKLGRKVFIVVEKPSELDTIIKVSARLKVKPLIGIRAKLAARGRGKWEGSGGDRSKFGLLPEEMLDAVQKLKKHGMLDSLQLLHFHLGSQITSIQSIKEALRESTRLFVELSRLGVNIRYFDVGGGLAVDYDGSMTNFSSSANYTLQEYAADIVSALAEICQENGIAHPTIISESGRALVAYHSILVFNILGISEFSTDMEVPTLPKDAPESLTSMKQLLDQLSVKNFQESYHDAIQIRDETLTLFNVGILSLEHRAVVEKLFWLICHKIAKIIDGLDYVPDELENLQAFISDTYYGNLSVFQSLPDHWAVKQLFPMMPIHRHTERPVRKATLADITCDSDGKVDQFIDLRDVKSTIDLHELQPNQPYYLGAFLVGAYQEILGDLHNLFGDTHTVHVSVTGKNKYRIDKIVEGDTVRDVLAYMQYQKRDLMVMIRQAVEESIEKRRLSIKESARIQRFLEEGIEGYTYLE